MDGNKTMNEHEREQAREQAIHAGLVSAVVGPLLVQSLVGVVARLQNFFCPLNFLPIYAVSFILLAPGFFFSGWAGATAATRIGARWASPRLTVLALAIGGGLFGLLYLEITIHLIEWFFSDYTPLLALPGLRASFFAVGAVTANWSRLPRRRRVEALSLK
jgi:hypothetical protein